MARTPKPLDPQREARLLRAAAEAFLADGFEHASLNRIIKNAGIAKSSSYHYFGGKRALYDHLLKTFRTHLNSRLISMDLDSLTRENFWSELDA